MADTKFAASDVSGSEGERELALLTELLQKQRREKQESTPLDVYRCAALVTRWSVNARLPICLLCQNPTGPKVSQRGHFIPLSVLKRLRTKHFVDKERGVSGDIKSMGYCLYCPDCEKRFSDDGEQLFAPKLISPLVENIHKELVVDALRNEDRLPWLYYCVMSIVWRCLATIQNSRAIFLKELEAMRLFLLSPRQVSSLTGLPKLYLFVANMEMLATREQWQLDALCNMVDARISSIQGPNEDDIVWICCGPLHIMAILKDYSLPDCCSANNLSATTNTFTFASSKNRGFPQNMVRFLFTFANNALCSATRDRTLSEMGNTDEPSSVDGTFLNNLPKDVSYNAVTDMFQYPSYYKVKGQERNGQVHCVLFQRGHTHGGFVAVRQAFANDGHMCLAVEVDFQTKRLDWFDGKCLPNNVNIIDLGPERILPFLNQRYSLLERLTRLLC